MDGNYPGTKLTDPQGVLSKEVPSSSISAANTEITAVLQPSATGAKAVRGTYLKISAEKKAKIVSVLRNKASDYTPGRLENLLVVDVAYLSSTCTNFLVNFSKQLFAKI